MQQKSSLSTGHVVKDVLTKCAFAAVVNTRSVKKQQWFNSSSYNWAPQHVCNGEHKLSKEMIHVGQISEKIRLSLSHR